MTRGTLGTAGAAGLAVLAMMPGPAHAQRSLAGAFAGGIIGGIIGGAIIANARPAPVARVRRVVVVRPVARRQAVAAAPALPEGAKQVAVINASVDPFSKRSGTDLLTVSAKP